ncbi:uncharacterized protein LAESUDRAFT_810261 [Laetiporus sulphureus 93-53]|uniref:Uncharacterized protein n=1 Tax=Laetiporus sulphureus 93-53 TaxID=1314785 RepID=A0A165G7C9_9APHY|nr:uncharacterized protein LAESUDRAFT_810261 [Laetiporus sulphureus 93-53]KZT09930.1 hypothetical protein LAESUDRAFT_810261 [Laetiporus sulphureus 93-53]
MASDPTYDKAAVQEAELEEETRHTSRRSGDLEAALASMSRRTMRYEHQIKDLQSRLTVDMSNSRAIHNLLQEVLAGLQQNQRRTDLALTTTVPHIENSLDDDLATLQELEEHLPHVGQQVVHIRRVYNHGRDKVRLRVHAESVSWHRPRFPSDLPCHPLTVFSSDLPLAAVLEQACELMSALEWLNIPVSSRLRTIIFTSNAPVSFRWKALIRTLFALALLACIWIAWITIQGAVRAHRQRLVWGERLMS